MLGKQKADTLSVEELEKLLLVKRRQSRLERYNRLSGQGRPTDEALLGQDTNAPPLSPPDPQVEPDSLPATGFQPATVQPLGRFSGHKAAANRSGKPQERTRARKIRDAILLSLEVVALVGLVAVLVASYYNLKELNDEVAVAQQNAVDIQIPPTPSPTPPIALALLPGGHSSPTAPGGAVPDVPPHLQKWVQPGRAQTASAANIQIEQQEAAAPTRIAIPKINVDAPIVEDVSWEALKKGVGHLPGSANPGERGNLYLAAHNDIYGQIFRYLNELEPGDEYFVYAGEQKFRYVVREKRIIDPTEVEVMMPTTEPVATLQTCYPYLVDTHRLVVIGELAE
jgi:sortase A